MVPLFGYLLPLHAEGVRIIPRQIIIRNDSLHLSL